MYVGGGYQGCEATISTTTVTTSVNTSPIVPAFECVANYGTCFPGGTSCSDDVPKLNANLLATCATVAGTLACKDAQRCQEPRGSGLDHLVRCALRRRDDNMITEFTEPGGRAEDVGSVFNT